MRVVPVRRVFVWRWCARLAALALCLAPTPLALAVQQSSVTLVDEEHVEQVERGSDEVAARADAARLRSARTRRIRGHRRTCERRPPSRLADVRRTLRALRGLYSASGDDPDGAARG